MTTSSEDWGATTEDPYLTSKSFKNCSFWTYENGGTAAEPSCYQYKKACCVLKTEAANGLSSHAPHSISGSMKPVAKVTCRDGTQCGGTNQWTTWHDSTLPNRQPPPAAQCGCRECV